MKFDWNPSVSYPYFDELREVGGKIGSAHRVRRLGSIVGAGVKAQERAIWQRSV
jgi:hypothetical protein